LLDRLRTEYQQAGDDLDRKQQLIQWALRHGRPAVVALNPLALREGKTRLADYLQALSRSIADAPRKNVAGVLAANQPLKTRRDALVRFSTMAGKLRDFLATDRGREFNGDAAPGFDAYLTSQEQATIETWKARMGYAGMDAEEIVVFELTNLARRQNGLPPLLLDPRLSRAAREHSMDMVKYDFFSHESPLPGKKAPNDRARRHGTSGGTENIYKGKDGDSAVKSWMKSEGHRENILNKGLRRIGVGRWEDRYTQMFGG
jgi:hypothetical protein